MATYKVLQDIESEDKLLGPLTLKQFIFAAIFVGIGFLQFMIIGSGLPLLVIAPIVLVLLVPMGLFGFLAAPISQDQPNDVWLLARLRFMFKPHKRIWNQDGLSQLVTITAPKKVEHIYTNNLTQTEVKSRLQALANTVDSRGWAVKNVNVSMFTQPDYLTTTDSDRLVDPSVLPQEVPSAVVTAADDILDDQNPTAQHLEQLVEQSTKSHMATITAQTRDDPASATPTPQDYWFMNQTTPQDKPVSIPDDYSTFQNQQVVQPGGDDAVHAAQATAEEEALGNKLAHEHQDSLAHISDHMKTLQPLHNPDGTIRKQAQPASQPQPAARQDYQGQTVPNPAIIDLAHNDDLNVATIARQAKQISEDDDEVVVSLH